MAISHDATSVPLELIEIGKDGNINRVVTDHPAVEVWSHINPVDTPKLWWQSVYADLIVFGNHYSWADLDKNGYPVNLIRLPAHQVTPKPDRKNIVQKYIWEQVDGKKEYYDINRIIHFKTRNLQTPYIGMPILDRLRSTIVLEQQMRRWNYARFKNTIWGTVFLTTEKTIGDEEEKEELLQYLKQKMAGVEKTGDPVVLDGENWDIKVIDRATETDIGFLEGMKFLRQEYAMVLDLPPAKLSVWDDAFRSNSTEMDRQYWEDCIMSWHGLIEEFMNSIIMPRYWPKEKNLKWKYNYSGVKALAKSELEQAQVQQIYVREGIRSRNESRKTIGDNVRPEPEADMLLHNGQPLGEKPKEQLPGDGADPPPEDSDLQDSKKVVKLDSLKQSDDEEVLLTTISEDIVDVEAESRQLHSILQPVLLAMLAATIAEFIVGSKKVFQPESAEARLFVDGIVSRMARTVVGNRADRIKKKMAKVISGGTTKGELKKAVSEILEMSADDPEIATMARTLVHEIAEGSAYFASIDNDDIAEVEWLSARDLDVRGDQTGETRADHVGLDGDRIQRGGHFRDSKSGAPLRFPGDSANAITAADIVNCRCVLQAIMKDGTRQDPDSYWAKRVGTIELLSRAVRATLDRFFRGMRERVLEDLSRKIRRVG